MKRYIFSLLLVFTVFSWIKVYGEDDLYENMNQDRARTIFDDKWVENSLTFPEFSEWDFDRMYELSANGCVLENLLKWGSLREKQLKLLIDAVNDYRFKVAELQKNTTNQQEEQKNVKETLASVSYLLEHSVILFAKQDSIANYDGETKLNIPNYNSCLKSSDL